MINAGMTPAQPGLVARYGRKVDGKVWPTLLPVLAFDRDGNPMVFDPERRRLELADRVTSQGKFHEVTPDLIGRRVSIIPADGWCWARGQDTGPLVGWALMSTGAVKPMVVDPETNAVVDASQMGVTSIYHRASAW
ncbi:hypothetical protein [Solwaraspora sp. WMMD792]|uniref:hypothetical protein n=1 Tax=Solwaraspora sp. WMMD792 TaxID=3016099 RepID=UPI0024159BD9|nr:hypothetical protein [Solwaraspora sp. WMMD792]MDG4770679.1 hypothetical protein [Solwaraspora sp. WMMD792]